MGKGTLEQSKGRISAEVVTCYPPGIPSLPRRSNLTGDNRLSPNHKQTLRLGFQALKTNTNNSASGEGRVKKALLNAWPSVISHGEEWQSVITLELTALPDKIEFEEVSGDADTSLERGQETPEALQPSGMRLGNLLMGTATLHGVGLVMAPDDILVADGLIVGEDPAGQPSRTWQPSSALSCPKPLLAPGVSANQRIPGPGTRGCGHRVSPMRTS